MSTRRTAWHPAFASLLREQAPPWIEVQTEVSLTTEPLRVDDLLLLRPHGMPDVVERGLGLRRLWSYVNPVALLEFKSRAREFRSGDLHRLIAYGALWCATQEAAPVGVTLVLAVPRVNDALLRELRDSSLTLVTGEGGYHDVRGAHLRVVVAELRRVAEDEPDDLLRWFAESVTPSLATLQWVRHHVSQGSDEMTAQITPDLEGYDQIVREIIEGFSPRERLLGLSPEQRLAGLAPEQRLAGLAPEEIARALSESDRVLALPDAALRALPDDYIATLPAETQVRIRARRG